jgi:hypothetical protein
MSDKHKDNPYYPSKYQALIRRSFNTKLALYLFKVLKETSHLDTIEEAEFIAFDLNNDIAVLYEKAWQEKIINGIDVVDFDRAIDNWYKGSGDLKIRLYSAYKKHYTETVLTIESFNKIYEDDTPTCIYCKITEKQILELRQGGSIKTKRNRGKTMEIDRINSNMEYSSNNIVLACYYCNNAKTDEFTIDEFKAVGIEIGKILINRLSKINGV